VRSLAKWSLVAGVVVSSSGCTGRPKPIDFTRSEPALFEADVAHRDRSWVVSQLGRSLRIHDVVLRTLPASPASRLRYRVDIPKGARLTFSCGIPEDRHGDPAVEYVITVRRGNREDVVFNRLVDPLRNPDQRRWLSFEVDLSRHAGAGAVLSFETRGYLQDDDPTAAFWGTPMLIVPRPAPLVVVYLVDTLRADHTTVYGYERDTTPELARFAQDAVVFDQAIAQAPWTKPSIASLLTSLTPGRHGVILLRDTLAYSNVTLAEMLAERGYATGAVITNSVIYSDGTYFDQGFDSFTGIHGPRDRPTKIVEAAPAVDTALAWLDTRRGQPAFLFVHTMDPHVPYTPPPPFDRRYEPYPAPGHPGADPRTDYTEPLDRERLVAQYDGEIAYGDREFGRFVAELKTRGLYDDALIVFLSDHGEEFLDHGQWLHGRSVFDELIRIPLLVKFPHGRHAGRRVAEQVQEVDILPTVLASQGLPVPKQPTIAGLPLQQALEGKNKARPALSELSHRGNVAYGVRTVQGKYVRRFSPNQTPDPAEGEMYFDLKRDPKELENTIAAARSRVGSMKALAEDAMVANPYLNHLRLCGDQPLSLRLRTNGWIEDVQTVGFGTGDRLRDADRRDVTIEVHPRPGQPREVILSVRPVGAPVWIEGTRAGRTLGMQDIWLGKGRLHPSDVTLRLPEFDTDKERVEDIFTTPDQELPGLQLWLTLLPGKDPGVIDKDACERLKALGYIGGDVDCGKQ
jgi:arylsulfatase A-like enzyme